MQGSFLSDPLFPALNVNATALYRKVEICRPDRLPAPPSFAADAAGPWFEESELTWHGDRPAALVRSQNFSNGARIFGFNVSDRLLTTSIFAMNLHIPSGNSTIESRLDGFSYFEPGVFFASANASLETRIKEIKARPALISSEEIRDMVLSVFGVVVMNQGVAPIHFGRHGMTDRQAFSYIQEHCEPGDIRIRHFKFAPTEAVSIVALKSGETLEPDIINGIQIGAIAPGVMVAADAVTPITAKYEARIALPKFLLSIISIVTIFLTVRNPRFRVIVIVVAAWFIGMLRSLVWRSLFLQPRYWSLFAVLAAPLGVKFLL
jgi:hypothetical protein